MKTSFTIIILIITLFSCSSPSRDNMIRRKAIASVTPDSAQVFVPFSNAIGHDPYKLVFMHEGEMVFKDKSECYIVESITYPDSIIGWRVKLPLALSSK
jgi:hypothetical protein